MTKWTRIEDGYESGEARILDNGGGLGPNRGSGRWAIEIAGRWVANVDSLDEAKAEALDYLVPLAKTQDERETIQRAAAAAWERVS